MTASILHCYSIETVKNFTSNDVKAECMVRTSTVTVIVVTVICVTVICVTVQIATVLPVLRSDKTRRLSTALTATHCLT
jgi:hypothetical protein